MIAFRTLLFTPGNRPEMLEKAPTYGADALIIDLEDAVPHGDKGAARATAAEFVRSHPELTIFVRVNAPDTNWFIEDMRACVHAGAVGVMLPKTSRFQHLTDTDSLLTTAERDFDRPRGSTEIIPLIESVEGVLQIESILQHTQRCQRVAFGAYDFAVDLGISLPRDRDGLFLPRALTALHAHVRGLQPIDTVFGSVQNIEGLYEDAVLARSLGFTGKLCIHPDQIRPIRDVFAPSGEEVERARRIVAAFNDALESGSAAIEVDGELVDYPIARQARALMESADKE